MLVCGRFNWTVSASAGGIDTGGGSYGRSGDRTFDAIMRSWRGQGLACNTDVRASLYLRCL